jgi:hypothetical protein
MADLERRSPAKDLARNPSFFGRGKDTASKE